MSGTSDTVYPTSTVLHSSDPSRHGSLPPASVRFLIALGTLLLAFSSIWLICCVSYRLRRAQMRQLVVQAFEEGVFDRENVRERMVWFRRGTPPTTILHTIPKDVRPKIYTLRSEFYTTSPPSECQPFPLLVCPDSIRVMDLTEVQPLSAQLDAENDHHSIEGAQRLLIPHLSALPIESQLALLYQASRVSFVQKYQQKSVRDAHRTHGNNRRSGSRMKRMAVSLVISMPHSRDADEEGGEFCFGTAVYPYTGEDTQDEEFMGIWNAATAS